MLSAFEFMSSFGTSAGDSSGHLPEQAMKMEEAGSEALRPEAEEIGALNVMVAAMTQTAQIKVFFIFLNINTLVHYLSDASVHRTSA